MEKLKYLVEILEPHTHIINVKISFTKMAEEKTLTFFLPSWCPGSYLMREYAKDLQCFRALLSTGEVIFHEQISKGEYKVDFSKTKVCDQSSDFEINYQIYAHELTVRTSHVDQSHAYLHGPSYLMGLKEKNFEVELELKFPGLWSKVHTGLKDISTSRESFLYYAKDYDELLDCPIEIGCHESDGFKFQEKDHHVVFYGKMYAHPYNLKKDIETIVQTVASTFDDEVPYEDYLFITHLIKGGYGGLEHMNSTALIFDGRKFNSRRDYVNWLALVAHEYFHLWNVKRIRPKELGPFDYLNENYTTMLWLAEGLTSFMDELFVYRSKLCTEIEYLEMIKNHFNRFLSIPGKKFHSLEASSFNAWIKLYRPSENSNNSTISYYLKGGIVFFILNQLLVDGGSSINEFINRLWKRYKDDPEVGMTSVEVYELIQDLSSIEVREKFEEMIETTIDLDWKNCFEKMGLEVSWTQSKNCDFGGEFNYVGDGVFVKSVTLDGPFYRAGVNAGDEILAIDGVRFLKEDEELIKSTLIINQSYPLIISRLGRIIELDFVPGKQPEVIDRIKILDKEAFDRYLL